MGAVAIIPARGGSKRIPRKNTKLFLGKPIICYPIEVLLASELFDRIIVSTDDDEIADVAIAAGAEVPFVRPVELSDDHTGTGLVTQHALDWLIAKDSQPEMVCTVYATSPLLSIAYLQKGFDLLLETNSSYAYSVTRFPFPVQRAIKINATGHVEPMEPESMMMRSQDLDPAYHDAGQFYWAKSQALLDGIPMYANSTVPVVLPSYLVQDIDNEDDWIRAEYLYQLVNHQPNINQ